MASLEVKTEWAVYKDCFLQVARYQADNSRAIEIWNNEDGPIARITVCITGSGLAEDETVIDTNNCPWAMEFIKQHGFGQATGRMVKSGYCTYPVVKLDIEKIGEYKTGSKTAGYKAQVDKAYELAEKVIEARPTEEERVSKLCERYSRRLAQNINKDIQIGIMCPSVMISGAGNFPVKKKEKQVAAWDKNHEDYKEVEAILGKIEAIFYGKDVIKSDDENAIEKLQDKVDGLREDQERMKQANKAIRMKDKEKGDATLHDMGYTDEQIAQLREPDFCGRIGFPDYMLTNNNANIRRLEGRIKSLQKTKSQGTQESENKFFKVKENVEAMRIQLFFEGKPEPEVRDILKSNGFRWAPSVGAWQRQLNNNGKYAVERVIRELEEMEAAE